MLRRGSTFNGYSIEAMDGKVGMVGDFLFDDASWQLRWLVVDTGGWLTGRKILIHPSAFDRPDTKGYALFTRLTRAQVEASPSLATDEPVSLQKQHDLSAYYGWNGSSLDGNGIAAALVLPMPQFGTWSATPPPEQAATAEADPHLRSIAEVSGYTIHAVGGTIGHLDTFLIDDEDWTIRYLVVDTANWWIGKHVLIAPSAVTQIDWSQRFIHVDLTCYKIRESPEWSGANIRNRAYQQLQQVYYGSGGHADQTVPQAGLPPRAQDETSAAKVPA